MQRRIMLLTLAAGLAVFGRPGAARADGDGQSLIAGDSEQKAPSNGKKLVEKEEKVAPKEEKITADSGARELAEAKEAARGSDEAAKQKLVDAQRRFDTGTQQLVDEAKERVYPGGPSTLDDVSDGAKRLAGTAAGLVAGPAAAAWDQTGGAVVKVADAALHARDTTSAVVDQTREILNRTPEEAREGRILSDEQKALRERQAAVDAVEKPFASSFQSSLALSRQVSNVVATETSQQRALRKAYETLATAEERRVSIPGAGSVLSPQDRQWHKINPGGNSVTVAKNKAPLSRQVDSAFADDPVMSLQYKGIANIYNAHGSAGRLEGALPEEPIRKFLKDDKPLVVAACFSAAPKAGGSTIRRLVSAYGEPTAASRVYGCTGFTSAAAATGFGCTGVWLDANGQRVPLSERRRLRLVQRGCKVNVLGPSNRESSTECLDPH